MRASSTDERPKCTSSAEDREVAQSSHVVSPTLRAPLVRPLTDASQIPSGVRVFRFDQQENDRARWINDAFRLHDKRMRAKTVKLTEAELVKHVLSLFDVTKESLLVSDMADDSFAINRNVWLCNDGAKQPIDIYVAPFLGTRKMLRSLRRFSKLPKLGSHVAVLLQQFVNDFLNQHLLEVYRLCKDSSLNLLTLSTTLIDSMRAVAVVYTIVSVVIDVKEWDVHTVDLFLAQFFAVILYAELDQAARSVTRRLEASIFSLLELYFDQIFSTGTVASLLNDELIFFNAEKPSLLLGIRPSRCLLWSESFVNSVAHGARDARRFEGRICDFRKFSSYFEEHASLAGTERFVPLNDFLGSLEGAARMCVEDNERLLISIASEGGALSKMLCEIQSVFCGFAVREMDLDLFDGASSVSLTEIVQSFHNSLRISGFGLETESRWSVRCGSGRLCDLDIRPVLAWPLNYVIDGGLIAALNDSLRLLLKLSRARNSLSTLQLDEDLLRSYGPDYLNLCHLLNVIAQPLATMANLLYSQLHSLIARKIPLVIGSRSVCEAVAHLTALSSQLICFTSKKESFGFVYGAVDNLCRAAQEIAIRLAAGEMKDVDVQRMLRVAMRERSLLVGIGKGIEGTAFNALHLFLA